ncbi:MAG: hypothetical protein DMF76_19805, partial [Acidobacteria bacterium]
MSDRWNFQSQTACQQAEQPTCRREIATSNFRKEYRVMILTKIYRVIFCALIFGAVVAASPRTFAQDSNQPARASAQREDDVNLDTQLYL